MPSKVTDRGIRIGAALVAAAAVLALANGAQAENWAGNTGNTGCTGLNKADNGDHNYFYSELQTEMENATDWTRSNNLNPTNMSTDRVYDLTSLTDVVVLDRYYEDYCGFAWYHPSTGGVVGAATCLSLNGPGECEKHDVRYSNHFTDITSISNRRGLACHEGGHAVGLAHRDSAGCMPQGYPKPENDYSPHDTGHINSFY